jgi:hypothetical protein
MFKARTVLQTMSVFERVAIEIARAVFRLTSNLVCLLVCQLGCPEWCLFNISSFLVIPLDEFWSFFELLNCQGSSNLPCAFSALGSNDPAGPVKNQ